MVAPSAGRTVVAGAGVWAAAGAGIAVKASAMITQKVESIRLVCGMAEAPFCSVENV